MLFQGPSKMERNCSSGDSPDHKFEYSVSMTTRAQRPGEVDGRIIFRSREEFEELICKGQMLEYAEYVVTTTEHLDLC